ncbi:MAG: hypothetical protein COX65_03430 [Elusimicrobia bacterium CG_4_10_14_0_2_um_filter_56_8]|nr:MAG: hypothetical protein AUJ51_00855 [Elusimicrobia bacterium CG1_02_56_21]PJA16001.1 MAG: hypothetical protein COX65_03430 [Elusimicrobia bacterium CG_4_10_14_0_2_um_filter_56_8]
MNMGKPRIFLVEDEQVSKKITMRMLRETGLEADVREGKTLAAGLSGLAESGVDILLLDLNLPDSGGLDTLKAVCGKFPALAVVVMTGTEDGSMGLDALKLGAQDYLVKGQFGHRELARTIRYAIERKQLLNEKEELISRLQDALKRVKKLTGLLPTCADCKKIKTAEGKWVQMESYISGHSEAQFSHGFCDACYKKRLKEIK